jgi:phosphoribosylformylglycinamidine synthase
VDLSKWRSLPVRALLFGEAQGRILVSTDEPAVVLAAARKRGVPGHDIGLVRPHSSDLRISVGALQISAPLARLAERYHEAIPRAMAGSRLAVQVAEEPTAAGSLI